MRWPEAIEELVATVSADAQLVNLLGGAHVYETADIRAARIPSIGWTLVEDHEDEATDPFTLQWDVFAPVESYVAIERRLRLLVTWRSERVVGGIRMMCRIEAGRAHPVQNPGERHRSFDVRYEPARIAV